MKTEIAPISFGFASLDPVTAVVGALAVFAVLLLAFGMRRELAMVVLIAGFAAMALSA